MFGKVCSFDLGCQRLLKTSEGNERGEMMMPALPGHCFYAFLQVWLTEFSAELVLPGLSYLRARMSEKLEILYEDNHLIAINKRASDIVQGDKTGDETLGEKVKQYLKEKYKKPGEVFIGVIHRLDRPVSGVVLFARTSKGLARMNELFRGRDVQKIYWAVVKDKPEKNSDTLVHFLYKNEKQNKSFADIYERPGRLRCELDYRLLASSDNYHLLEVVPHTGRHHQIRVQLAAIGCPIKGDLKYGARRSNPDASIHLHARQLEFTHPVKNEKLVITAPPPQEPLWQAFLEQVEAKETEK
ncbi:MAG: 23S rRNA pseudouridine synthase [Bacteroidetes bacterium]|nr:MAG: 23S rRNA pseudouridine synthase [Bacteroidota bacterium]